MVGKPFKVAYLSIDSVNDMRSYAWLTGDGEPYQEMDSLEFDDEFIGDIYAIYKDAYSRISSVLYLNAMYRTKNYYTLNRFC